jgi:transcriptional regulator with XRE-family HTH domain
MGHPRPKPQNLASKLLAIRRHLGASQSEMVKLLKFHKSIARLSEYESGTRVPDLLTLLQYAKVARVRVEALIDDAVDVSLRERKKRIRSE